MSSFLLVWYLAFLFLHKYVLVFTFMLYQFSIFAYVIVLNFYC